MSHLKCKFTSYSDGKSVIVWAKYITPKLIECYSPSWNVSEVASVTFQKHTLF